jgi:hypothetical protein
MVAQKSKQSINDFKRDVGMGQCKIIAEKLKAQEDKLFTKKKFCKEHNFNKEADYIETKISVIREIRFELEIIESGVRTAKESKFDFE